MKGFCKNEDTSSPYNIDRYKSQTRGNEFEGDGKLTTIEHVISDYICLANAKFAVVGMGGFRQFKNNYGQMLIEEKYMEKRYV